MPEHLIKSFYIAKEFCDNVIAKRPARLPALKGEDLHNVMMYIKLLTPQPQIETEE